MAEHLCVAHAVAVSSCTAGLMLALDRFRGGYPGDGDWTSARRYYIIQDSDLNHINSQLVQDLGEVNMADGAALVEFATWAIETFPADKHVLILSDHGLGWPGGWSDPAPGGSGDPSIPLSSALREYLYLNELDTALQEIRDRTGPDKFEMIGMDACYSSRGRSEFLAFACAELRGAELSALRFGAY